MTVTTDAMNSTATAPLPRNEVVSQVLGDPEGILFTTGLGGPGRDVVGHIGDSPNLFALGGAMGASTTIGLGLALAQPERLVYVVTGDGEMLMNVGALATIAVLDPPNLSILVVDNGHYGETGNQLGHTAQGVDLERIAAGSGIKNTCVVETQSDVRTGHDMMRDRSHTSFVVLRVDESEPPAAPRSMDAAYARMRFRKELLG